MCSAALPTIGTTMIPTKNSDQPSDATVGSNAPTRISLIHAMASVAPVSTAMAVFVLQVGP